MVLTLYIATNITTKLKISEYIAALATPVFKLQQQQQPCFKAGILSKTECFYHQILFFFLLLNYTFEVMSFSQNSTIKIILVLKKTEGNYN